MQKAGVFGNLEKGVKKGKVGGGRMGARRSGDRMERPRPDADAFGRQAAGEGVHVQLGWIARELQHLGVNHTAEVLRLFRSWLAAMNPLLPSSERIAETPSVSACPDSSHLRK